MNIIFIHGMNQQHETAQTLKKRWLGLLENALIQTQQQNLLPDLIRHFRMPFYGDLLSRYHLNNMLNASTLLPQTWPHIPFLHTSTRKTPTKTSIKNEVKKYPQHDLHHKFHQLSAISKDYALHGFALLLNDFPKLHATLLHQFLVETDLYLSNPILLWRTH